MKMVLDAMAQMVVWCANIFVDTSLTLHRQRHSPVGKTTKRLMGLLLAMSGLLLWLSVLALSPVDSFVRTITS